MKFFNFFSFLEKFLVQIFTFICVDEEEDADEVKASL